MALYIGDTLISGEIEGQKLNLPFTLFEFQFTDHLLNNASWLRADTFSWQSGAVYVSAYEHLVDEIDGITAETETIAGYTVTFYRATDGHKICLANQESTVADIYTATGVAWYYILDTTNTRFKLPRTKFGVTGLRGSVGDYVEAGLPNITGSVQVIGNTTQTGAFYTDTEHTSYLLGNASSNYGLGFDASLSDKIYGNSTTVQPPATQMYLYFYVGETIQDVHLIDAGQILSQLNRKVDIDLSNMNPTQVVKNTIIGWEMPDYNNGVSITIPNENTNTTWEAPSNGYVSIVLQGVYMNQYLLKANGNLIWQAGDDINGNTKLASAIIPLKKGVQLNWSYPGYPFENITTTFYAV